MTPEKDLEHFIHQELQKLPEHQAPDEMVANVLGAIAARQNLPWWKQPFSCWPRMTQASFSFCLLVLLAVSVLTAWKPAQKVHLSNLLEYGQALAWIPLTIEKLFGALTLAFTYLPSKWLMLILTVLAAAYGICLAAGFALARIISPRSHAHVT